jgi:hypothetical protein
MIFHGIAVDVFLELMVRARSLYQSLQKKDQLIKNANTPTKKVHRTFGKKVLFNIS